MYGILTKDFNLPPSYVEGKYVVKCTLTRSDCTCCNGPLYTRKCEYARLVLDGILQHQAYFLTATQVEDDWRNLVIQGFIQTGEWPKKKGKTKEETLKRIRDPHGEFPYDIKFPSNIKVNNMADLANTSAKMQEDKGKKVPEHFKWNSTRINAAKGALGDVARRAALNDILWGRYISWSKQGIDVTADLLKSQVEFEVALRELHSAEDEDQKAALFEQLSRKFL